MRCPLLVSERMFSRPKLTVVVSYLTAVLADRARLDSTLWLATRPVLGAGRRELDQMDWIVFEESTRKLRRDPRWMYLRRGRKTMSGWRCSAVGGGSSQWKRSLRSSTAGYCSSPVTGRRASDRRVQANTNQVYILSDHIVGVDWAKDVEVSKSR